MLERLGRGLTFVAGSVVGGLALAFLIVALRPDLIRGRPNPPACAAAPSPPSARRRRRRRASATRTRCSAPPRRSSTSTPTGW